MARKKKDSGAQYLVFVVAILLLVVLTFVVAVWIVGLWLYREITSGNRIAELKGQLGHTNSELSAIRELEERNRQLLEERRDVEAKGAELSRRKDGYFQERSSHAKALNAQLKVIVDDGKRTEEELRQLRQMPGNRRSECVELAAARQSSRVAVVCLAAISGLIAVAEPSWAASFGTWIINWGLWVPNLNPTLYTAAIVSTWAAFGLQYLAKEGARSTIAEKLVADLERRPDTASNPTRS